MTTQSENVVRLLFEVKDFEPSSWTWYFLNEKENKVEKGFNLVPLQDHIRVTGKISNELEKMFVDLLGTNEIRIYFSAPDNMKELVKGYLLTERYVFKSFRKIQLPDGWDFSHQEDKKEPFRDVKIFAK